MHQQHATLHFHDRAVTAFVGGCLFALAKRIPGEVPAEKGAEHSA